ncbi:MAG: hypothetical protein GY906_37110 [bacterium]|nr:hypothetical protein [bacterium]
MNDQGNDQGGRVTPEATPTSEPSSIPVGSEPTTPSTEEPPVVGVTPPAAEPPAHEYSRATLKDKSPQEIEAYVEMLEGTTLSQSRALTQAHDAAAVTPPPAAPEESVDFFDQPAVAIQQALDKTVAPLREEIRALRNPAPDPFETVAREFANFETYRPYIDQMLRNPNMAQVELTDEIVRAAYYSAVGYVASRGGTVPMAPTEPGPAATPSATPVPPQGDRMVPPQNRPSSAPPPAPPVAADRALTEHEERLRREWKMTKEEFLNLQEMPEDEVITHDRDAIKTERVPTNA